MNFTDGYDEQEGEMVLIDKPLNWTSFDVVKKIKYALSHKLGIKKIKVGHAGTLDPLASGLVIVGIGKYTKKMHMFQDMPKNYLAGIQFGATTPSYDLETEVNNTFPTAHITLSMLQDKSLQFLGEQDQVPPVYSAKKHEGVRAYDHARKGRDITMKPARIEIYKFEILSYENDLAMIDIQCSKGTYIRSIAHDIGKTMQSGAYLKSLRRTGIGNYRVENALNVEEIEKKIKNL